jgi:putative transcriptional regulator
MNDVNAQIFSGPHGSPTREDIKSARVAVGLTQVQAADVVQSSVRAWQHWEAGTRKMHGATWELFCKKTGTV